MSRPDLPQLVALFAQECRIAFRGAAFWSLAAAGALVAAWRAATPGATSAIAAYRAAEVILLGLGVLAIFLAAASAARDRRQRAAQLVLAKPQGSSPSLVLLRFAAVWVSLAVISAIALAASSLAQIAVSGTAWHPYPYAHALARTLLPVGLAAALGFSLSTIFTTSLASAVAAIYWVVIPLTRPHVATVFDLTLSQHWPFAALLTALLTLLTAAFYARPIRDRGPATAQLGWAVALLLLATSVAAYSVATNGTDALLDPDPILSAIAAQSCLADPRAPGFWLPDAHGRLIALSDHTNRPIVLTFWGPAVGESAGSLMLIRDLAAEFRSLGLARIAVCVDRDRAAMQPFMGDAGSDTVMLWDRGRHFGDGTYAGDSPAAVAYDVGELPTTFILDRERRVTGRIIGDASPDRVRAEVTRAMGP